MIYGWTSAIIGFGSLLLLRDSPHPLANESKSFVSSTTSVITLFKNRNMRIGIFLFMVGLGLFNAISSLTDAISANLHINDSDGLLATVMLLGGMLGSVIIPVLSDYFQVRKKYWLSVWPVRSPLWQDWLLPDN